MKLNCDALQIHQDGFIIDQAWLDEGGQWVHQVNILEIVNLDLLGKSSLISLVVADSLPGPWLAPTSKMPRIRALLPAPAL